MLKRKYPPPHETNCELSDTASKDNTFEKTTDLKGDRKRNGWESDFNPFLIFSYVNFHQKYLSFSLIWKRPSHLVVVSEVFADLQARLRIPQLKRRDKRRREKERAMKSERTERVSCGEKLRDEYIKSLHSLSLLTCTVRSSPPERTYDPFLVKRRAYTGPEWPWGRGVSVEQNRLECESCKCVMFAWK